MNLISSPYVHMYKHCGPTLIKPAARAILITITAAAISNHCLAEASPVGLWETRDNNNQLESTVRISPSASNPAHMVATIVTLHKEEEKGSICTTCSGERHNQPIEGMEVLWSLAFDDKKKVWYGKAVDPNRGWEPEVRVKHKGDTLEICAYYKTDIVCLDKTIWYRPGQTD